MNSDVRRLPRWFPLGGFAWGETIWAKHPDWPEVIRHEQTHLDQQRGMGKWRFLWRYVMSCTFRAQAEAAAYRAQGYDAAGCAQRLRAWFYFLRERVIEGAVKQNYGSSLSAM